MRTIGGWSSVVALLVAACASGSGNSEPAGPGPDAAASAPAPVEDDWGVVAGATAASPAGSPGTPPAPLGSDAAAVGSLAVDAAVGDRAPVDAGLADAGAALRPDAAAVQCGDGRCQAAENCATCEMDCGICADPRPDASADCAHTECESGGPLAASCGDCAASICAADPFCCDTAWDNLCVGRLAAVCGKTCP